MTASEKYFKTYKNQTQTWYLEDWLAFLLMILVIASIVYFNWWFPKLLELI